MRCLCSRYSTPCVGDAELLLCPDCVGARCVLIEFLDDGERGVEHISADDLIIDPEDQFEVGAKVLRP
jgi:hypothetical protein